MQTQQDSELLYDLYDTIALGESRRELIQRRCLLLIGLTRVGKSTLFNWINDRPLVGRTGDFNGLNYYLVNDKEQTAAEVSDGHSSKTLIPNVYNMGEVTRIDTAGFKDSRNHVGVFSVSCMLNFIFQKGQQYSFLLVINRDRLWANAEGILDTLYHFITLFDYGKLDGESKRELFRSVCLVVTKAEGPTRDDAALNYLKGIIRTCSRNNYRYEKKDICLELLSDIVEGQRIEYFRVAIENVEAPKCDIVQSLMIRGWSTFNMVKARAKCPCLFVNSFDRQFNDLYEDDKISYWKLITDKVAGYTTVATIFEEVIHRIIEGAALAGIDYGPIFSKMAEYNAQFDRYTSVNRDLNWRSKFNGMSLRRQSKESLRKDAIKTMANVRAVMGLVCTIDQISKGIAENDKLMDILKQTFIKIFLTLQELCCRNAEEEATLISFAFIVLRGFEDFKVITRVDTVNREVTGNSRKIYDYLVSASNLNIQDCKLAIVKNISSLNRQQKSVAFPKAEELNQYVVFAQEFMLECKDIDKAVIEDLRRKNIVDRFLCCELMLNQGDRYREVLVSSIGIFEELIGERGTVIDIPLQQVPNDKIRMYKDKIRMQAEVIVLQNFFLSCARILGKVLMKKQQFALAIEVFTTIEESAMVCECYEFLLQRYYGKIQGHDKAGDCAELQDIYRKYSEYCKYHGRIEKAVGVLQEYHKLVTDGLKLRKVKGWVGLLLRDREQCEAKYHTECEEQVWFIELDQKSLVELVEAIKSVVNVDCSPVVSPNHTMVV